MKVLCFIGGYLFAITSLIIVQEESKRCKNEF